MAVTDDARTLGRARLDFADERDIDEFVDMLGKFERDEISPEDWRRFRLVRGTYGQRQDNVQMLRIKIPQGILTGSQMRALADVAARYSRGFCHVTTRQNIQFHFVPLSVVRDRHARAGGRRPDDARGVRQLGAQHHRLPVHRDVTGRGLRRHAVRRSADALLPASSARREAAAQVQDRLRGLRRRITRSRRSTTSAGARASRTAGAASA